MNLKKIIKTFLICSTLTLPAITGIKNNLTKNADRVVAEGVTTAEGFKSALSSGGTYIINNDLTIEPDAQTKSLVLSVSNSGATIDLNSKTIDFSNLSSYASNDSEIQFNGSNGASVTFKNGTLKFNGNKIMLSGSGFNLNNVYFNDGFLSGNNSVNILNSHILINKPGDGTGPSLTDIAAFEINSGITSTATNSTFENTNYNYRYNTGNAFKSSGVLEIRGCTFKNFYPAINAYAGNITIVDSVFTNNASAIRCGITNTINVFIGGSTKIYNDVQDGIERIPENAHVSFLTNNDKPKEGLDVYVNEATTIYNAVDVNAIKLPNGNKFHYISLNTQSKSRLGIAYQRDYSKPNEYKISKDASGKNLLTMSFVSRMKIDMYNSLASATYTLGMKYFVSGSDTLVNVNLADERYVNLVKDVTIPNTNLTRVDENTNKSENGEYYAWGVDIPNIPLDKLDQKIYVVGYIKCNDLYYYSTSQCESVKTLATKYYDQGINNQECSYKEHLGMLNWLKNYTVGGQN